MIQLPKIIILKGLLCTLLALSTVPLFAALPDDNYFITYAVSQDDTTIFTIHPTVDKKGVELHVTDTTTGDNINTITLPLIPGFSQAEPRLIASLDGKKIYITDIDKKLYLVDLDNKSVERIKGKPKQNIGRDSTSVMTLSPDGKFVYIADSVGQFRSHAFLHILDTETNKIIEKVKDSTGCCGWKNGSGELDPNSSNLYLSNETDYRRYDISVFDTQTRRFEPAKIKVNYRLKSMAVHPFNGRLYLTREDEIYVVDPVSGALIEEIIPADRSRANHSFHASVFASYGNKLYTVENIHNTDDNGIWVYDTLNKTTHTIMKGKLFSFDGAQLKSSADGSKLYVGTALGEIYIIDTSNDLVLKRLVIN